MRVRIIPEGVQHDHLILRPIFRAMFHHLGKDHAKIDIHSPEERGFDAVRATDHIRGIISEFRSVDLFVLCVDRDGDPYRREALHDLERRSQRSCLLRASSLRNTPGRRSRSGHWPASIGGSSRNGPGTRSGASATPRRCISNRSPGTGICSTYPVRDGRSWVKRPRASTPRSARTAPRSAFSRGGSAIGSRPRPGSDPRSLDRGRRVGSARRREPSIAVDCDGQNPVPPT
jgi:hypothetical protein